MIYTDMCLRIARWSDDLSDHATKEESIFGVHWKVYKCRCCQDMGASSVKTISFVFINRLSHWLVISSCFYFLSESQRSGMTDSELHTVLDRRLAPSLQEISPLDRNLGKTGTGGRHSVNASIPMPIPEAVIQINQHLTPISELHMSDHDLEKSGTSDSEEASISIPVLETETLDIEHAPVQNDPRKWSSFRKVGFLTQTPSWVLHHLFFTIHIMLPWP